MDANVVEASDCEVLFVDSRPDADFSAISRQSIDGLLNAREIAEAVDPITYGVSAAAAEASQWGKFLPAVVNHGAASSRRPLYNSESRIPASYAVGATPGLEQPGNNQIGRFGASADNPMVVGMMIATAKGDGKARIA